MEQITQYFEHMDYVSFGVIALPCVIIAVYGFLQVASGLAKGKNDKMQRYNNNGNSNNNSNNNSNSGGKRCTQKYGNGNIAAGTTAGNATAATAATATVANSYQQTNSNNNNNNNSGSKSNNATRKARYNNHNNHNNNNNKRHEAGNAAYNLQQKRSNVVAAGADAQSWHRFVTSSCIEEKFLGQHNPGHRNSTSSEATSEDINSSDEHSGKSASKSNRSGSRSGGANGGSGSGSGNNAAAGGGNNNSGGKSRSKRQQKAQSALKQSLNRTPAMVPGQSQVQQPLEQQPATAKASGKCSSSKQGKWRNSASCNSGANQKRGSSSSSGSNNKSKQTKCQSGNGKPAGSSSSSNNHSGSNHKSSNSNVNSLTKSSGNYSSSSSGGSNSSSALSSPGSSPNSSSSSGNSSSHSLNSTTAASSWSRNQHKIYRQNANFLVPPLRQYEHIELDDAALQQQLQRYLIEPHLLRVYGFPVESVVHEGAIEIFKCLPHMSFAAAHCMAVTETVMTVINCHDGLNTNNFEEEPTSSSSLSSSGSGNEASTSTDSGNISPRSLDSESAGEWSGSECESSNELYCNYDAPEEERSLAKQCVRCKQDFLVDELSGQYLTRDECSYHWGKYHRCYDGSAWVSRWTCCSSSDESDIGCTRHELHVWTGSVVGVNGPYRDFVHTRPRNGNSNGQTQTRAVYALDCEMSYTGRGLDVTKVSLVALNGQLVYEHYVRPDADIVDYNTRYSGVTAKDLKSCGVKTLAEVQRDLLELIDADTILIGHGLDNDLRALRLVHNTLIDTSIAFPHSSGFPYRRALRHLTKTHLNREIQSGDGATGHSSFEDSRACMELMLWRVRCELDSDGSWED